MNKETKSNIELRKELLKSLKSFNENSIISKKEEILLLTYLLNTNTYLSTTANYRNLTTLDVITNINNDFDLFTGDSVEQTLRESNKDLLHRITELENKLDNLYKAFNNTSYELNTMSKKYNDVIDENDVLKKKIKLYESIEQLNMLKSLDGDYSIAIELLEKSITEQIGS